MCDFWVTLLVLSPTGMAGNCVKPSSPLLAHALSPVKPTAPLHAASNDLHAETPGAVAPGAPRNK